MIAIEDILFQKVKSVITQWNDQSIYAVSFFVESNEAKTYENFQNVTEFAISYNTEEDCGHAGKYSEERWNYAFWSQIEVPIIDTYEGSPETEQLFQWYREQGITNIGYEEEGCYDADYNYIGQGPVGHYELLTIAANIACRLQKDGVLPAIFGKRIPIIVHGLEYAWYDEEATQKANPNGEAEDFLKALKNGFQ